MSTPLDVQPCAPARGAIAVITRMQFIPHECFELGVDSSARATRLPMATVFREAGPSAIQKKGKMRNGDKAQEEAALPDPAACGRAPGQRGCHARDSGMGPDHAPRSAVERDDFDLTQRRGRKSAKNEYNLKLPKFNRSRGAWRIAGAYIERGHEYSCAMAMRGPREGHAS
jgi:hypothetical protein